jgi:K+-transporting ATPase A subunit
MKRLFIITISLLVSLNIFGYSIPKSLKAAKPYNSVADILRTIDPSILPHAPAEPDELNAPYIQVLNQKAGEVRNYVAMKYYEDLSDLSNMDVIVLGIAIIPFEERDIYPGRVSNEQAFSCMIDAVGTLFLAGALISLWNEGASTSTILSVLKSIIKTSSGWFMVGWGVYKFGDCVGWW